MDQKNFFKELFRPENKKARMNIFTAFALGVLLLMMGNTFLGKPTEKETTPTPETEKIQTATIGDSDERNLEKRMEGILGKVDGAGEVHVMVTMGGSEELLVARNEKSEASTILEEGDTGVAKTTQSEKLENNVVMTDDGKGSTKPVVLSHAAPAVNGIIIVAQGGEDAVVKEKLMLAAQAVLDVPAHKVAILKMK